MINKLIQEEYQSANEKFPPFVNKHEAYAVLLEEVEETENELETIKRYLRWMWTDTKNNKEFEFTDELEKATQRLIKESVQVGAMVMKYKDLVNKK